MCGAAARNNETRRVPDVHLFPGHIAYDAASRSELVVPVRAGGRVVGVLDLDSPELDRFSESDQAAMEEIVRMYKTACDWDGAMYSLN